MFLDESDYERDHSIYRYFLNREYFMDNTQYSAAMEAETKMTPDPLKMNPYYSEMNLDNHPTHENSEGQRYCGGTKNWRLIDPACDDVHSLHNAGLNSIYLLLKN